MKAFLLAASLGNGLRPLTDTTPNCLPAVTPCDLGRHVLPALVGRMLAHQLHAPLTDIGTPESYQRAQARVHETFLSERRS